MLPFPPPLIRIHGCSDFISLLSLFYSFACAQGIFIAALVTFFAILLTVALLGILVIKDVHLSTTALQAEIVIVWGCICITSGMVTVLFYGLKFNTLLEKHKVFLTQSQLNVLKETFLQHDLGAESSTEFLGVVDNIKDNLERDDRLFTIFGYTLDSSLVKQIQAAVFSLLMLGLSTTLTFLRDSL